MKSVVFILFVFSFLFFHCYKPIFCPPDHTNEHQLLAYRILCTALAIHARKLDMLNTLNYVNEEIY